MSEKKRVAVIFGGRAPEHDVSVVSGLQMLQSIDTSRYGPFPVYIAEDGTWYTGDALRERENFIPKGSVLKGLTPVQLDCSATNGKGVLKPTESGFFNKKDDILFDVILPVFHGNIGEDGAFQGMMELAGVAYAGMRAKACAIYMDKDTTKKALAGSGIPQLPYATILKPDEGLLVNKDALEKALSDVGFPCCVKPAHLGSSIGVGKAKDLDEARAILANIFKMDDKAIIEPFIEALVEYNVAVRQKPDGSVSTSAIERPKTDKELLDFKEKYMAGSGQGSKKLGGQKVTSGPISEGMLSLTRELNPDIGKDDEDKIRGYAEALFTIFDPAGAPRIDFISDGNTGEIWFNELNPIPGSYGYFLWEAGDDHVLLTDFLTDLIEEALMLHERKNLPDTLVPKDAQLLSR
ncbi:MAG: D-alanine--D-alanine ligase [Pseudomonadota bacterium]